MKRATSALAIATALTAGAAQADLLEIDTKTLELYGVRVGNPVDPATWWDAGNGKVAEAEQLDINPMDPDFWMAFIDPKRHNEVHATFSNPATLAQFMELGTYGDMMDVDVWAKWLDLDSYAPLLDLQTYAYWMQPGAWFHDVDLSHIDPMLEVENYTVVLTTAFDTMGVSQWYDAGAKAVAAATE